MAEISPFSGVRYNEEIVGDLALVICPPYDVISPEAQKNYHQRSEYNAVRLEFGMEMAGDTKTNNKNTRAGVTFDQWLKDRVLKVDHVPSFYVHEHVFAYQNMRRRRLGLMACVRLEPWEKKMVLPHENTVSGIKSDRLDLMRACDANFSPLLALYEDPGQRVHKLLASRLTRKPVADFAEDGDTHKLWIANEPEFVQRVSHFLASKPIYIADGHHRYETALAYRNEKRQHSASARADEAFNFVMMTLVSFSDPGLVMLPVHRLVRNLSPEAKAKLKTGVETLFQVEKAPLGPDGMPEMRGAVAIAVGLEPDKPVSLRPRQAVSLRDMMPAGHSEAYKRLDVSIVQHLIIDKLRNIDKNSGVAYTPNTLEALRLVEDGDFQLAFLMSPMSVATIKTIADANDRMPGKSTYFHPKLPTGLVISRLEGRL